jgi:hypothetical protein
LIQKYLIVDITAGDEENVACCQPCQDSVDVGAEEAGVSRGLGSGSSKDHKWGSVKAKADSLKMGFRVAELRRFKSG